VPDPRDIPLMRWGESLRRDRDERKGRRLCFIVTALVAILITALLLTMVWPPRPALVWNASASAPIGLYRLEAPGELARGDMVVAWAPLGVRRLAAERHYLPANVPLVKRVAAGPGDRVCAAGEAVFVNGALAARRRETDEAGRPLPAWSGCFELGEGHLLLLMPAPDSFDGRYFGLSSTRDVVGRARLIWRG
jgi:conjugative transfer signal peptidase TraF